METQIDLKYFQCKNCSKGVLYPQRYTFRQTIEYSPGKTIRMIRNSWTLFGWYMCLCDTCGFQYAVDPDTGNYVEITG